MDIDMFESLELRRAERARAYASELGAYEALLNYAIQTLKGESAASNESVARYLILQRNAINERLNTLWSNQSIKQHEIQSNGISQD